MLEHNHFVTLLQYNVLVLYGLKHQTVHIIEPPLKSYTTLNSLCSVIFDLIMQIGFVQQGKYILTSIIYIHLRMIHCTNQWL